MGRIFISFVLGFLVIGGILVYQATQGTSSLIFSPKELLAKGSNSNLQRIRVAGKVSDPIDYKTEPAIELRFLVTDPSDASSTIPVVYRNLKPDMFAAGRDVLIDGDFEGGSILAAKLLTQCPSKYEPPSPGEAYAHPGAKEQK
jgi:cytochrome c-type biogenesis protein CcmE